MHIFLVREMGLNTIQCYPYTKVSKNRKPGMHQFGRSVEGPNTIRPYQLQKDRKKTFLEVWLSDPTLSNTSPNAFFWRFQKRAQHITTLSNKCPSVSQTVEISKQQNPKNTLFEGSGRRPNICRHYKNINTSNNAACCGGLVRGPNIVRLSNAIQPHLPKVGNLKNACLS